MSIQYTFIDGTLIQKRTTARRINPLPPDPKHVCTYALKTRKDKIRTLLNNIVSMLALLASLVFQVLAGTDFHMTKC